ncbi:MAG TPA: MFS transporter [Oryzihumus sp.]|nr:MFS transporter [Oryzihumus sp.]
MSLTTGVLRDRRFLRLAAARTISTLGSGFGRVALAFGILALPGATPARLSLVLAVQALPALLFILAAGVVGDRFSRYRLIVGAELLAAVAWGALAAMQLTGWAPLPAILVAAALSGLASALLMPALSGVLPEFVAAEQLQSANAVLRVGQNLAMVLGLALSGVAAAVFGPGVALAVNAVSFVLSAVLISGMRLPSRAPLGGSALSDLRHGWREFSSRQWLWVVVVQGAFVLAAMMATVGVLGPLRAREQLGGARGWAVLVAAQAAGSILGAVVATRVRARRPVLATVLVTLVSALPMASLGFGAPLWVSAGAMFLCGVAADVCAVLWVSTMQREVPMEAMSRVSAYDLFGSLAFAPLGLLVAGPLASAIRTAHALQLCAAMVVVASLVALCSPAVRHLTLSQPADALEAEPVDEPVDALAAQPVDEPAGEREAQPVEEPADEPVDEPVGEPVDESAQAAAEEPAGSAPEQPAGPVALPAPPAPVTIETPATVAAEAV